MAARLSRLLGCNVYVSEGRNVQLVRHLERLCEQRSRVALANSFIDKPYNRSCLTLVATSPQELTSTVTALAQHALSAVDLRQHTADHPRLGVIDHVSLHPLGPEATLQLAAAAANDIGQRLAAPPIGLPVYYYGSAHRDGRGLAEVRRRLGYFTTSNYQSSKAPAAPAQQAWVSEQAAQGDSTTTDSSVPSTGSNTNSRSGNRAGSTNLSHLSSYPPDEGTHSASPAAGVVCIGAVPWVINYNVPLYTEDLEAVRAVARGVSTKGGGLPGVQAMALHHGPGVIEVATNLLNYDWNAHQHPTLASAAQASPADSWRNIAVEVEGSQEDRTSRDIMQGASPDDVQGVVEDAARSLGLPPPGQAYLTNKMPWELLQFAHDHFCGQS